MAQESTRDIVIELRTKVNALVRSVGSLADCIHGTETQPGIRSDIRALKDDVEILQGEKDKKDNRGWQTRMLIIGEIFTALGLIASIIWK